MLSIKNNTLSTMKLKFKNENFNNDLSYQQQNSDNLFIFKKKIDYHDKSKIVYSTKDINGCLTNNYSSLNKKELHVINVQLKDNKILNINFKINEAEIEIKKIAELIPDIFDRLKNIKINQILDISLYLSIDEIKLIEMMAL